MSRSLVSHVVLKLPRPVEHSLEASSHIEGNDLVLDAKMNMWVSQVILKVDFLT